MSRLRGTPAAGVETLKSNDANRTPWPVQGIDMRSLPIGPEEAFILSRVDGRATEADIASATGLDEERVAQALRRLSELGAIRFEATDGAAESQPKADTGSEPAARRVARISRPAAETPVSQRGAAERPADALYDPSKLDEEVDLDSTRKRAVLDLFYRLDVLSHYEILGVDRNADRVAIKNAYYQVVGTFHPDRYFGKNLGEFKPKLERVFARMTEAHDVLTRKRTREEYDQKLAEQCERATLVGSSAGQSATIGRIGGMGHFAQKELRADPPSGAPTDPAPPDSEQRRSPVESDPMPPGESDPVQRPRPGRSAANSRQLPGANALRTTPFPEPVVSVVPSSSDSSARRRALARKFGGFSTAPPIHTSTPAPDRTAAQQQAADELRRRYEQSAVKAKDQQIERYVAAAERAIEDDNPVAAANALHVAVSLAPKDQDLAARFEKTQREAREKLAENYLARAMYEERTQQFIDAASSYERAAAGGANAHLYERTAHCLLEGRGDSRRAVDHARQAVALDDQDASVHLTLARAYLASNMRQSALAELERATALSPNDETIKHWIKRVKRGQL